MRLACVGYRDWAFKIYKKISCNTSHKVLVLGFEDGYTVDKLTEFNPDIVLFYGWSWKVEDKIIDNFFCIMLHPSRLPKYRGGTPIQNQIIRGVKESSVTLFLMDHGIDSGPILAQYPLSLSGGISEIFSRIENIGYKLTMEILEKDSLIPVPQNKKHSTLFKRLKPENSEITIDEIKNKPAEYLYNKIRMLQNPYPNAFIKTFDGKKLMITCSHIQD